MLDLVCKVCALPLVQEPLRRLDTGVRWVAHYKLISQDRHLHYIAIGAVLEYCLSIAALVDEPELGIEAYRSLIVSQDG